MTHSLSFPGGTLFQEDIHLRELEDKHWLCNAGADRHVRPVSERRPIRMQRKAAVNLEVLQIGNT